MNKIRFLIYLALLFMTWHLLQILLGAKLVRFIYLLLIISHIICLVIIDMLITK